MKYLIFSTFYVNIFLLSQNVFALNSCQSRETCEKCIADSSKCVWCAMRKYNGSRCKSIEEAELGWCSKNKINPEVKGLVKEDLDFNSNTGKVVQIKPQHIKMALRPGFELDFEFSIKLAKDYPVDLYFLLDGSKTMKDVKTKTVDQTENIYRTMQNMTNNVYLGTGLFIDKNAIPFTRTNNSKLAYSFHNRLKLTNEFETFQKIVNATEFGVNNDAQEGTLDALAQVITCKEEIGWRNESTKIIIVLTDSPYHCAGDGKLAGIYHPYDGKCYTKNGIYTNEINMDYPSVSIINKLASDDEIKIIFAVAEAAENYYSSLSTIIKGSKVANYEEKNPLVMVDILKKNYKEITQNIKLKVNMDTGLRKYFKISFNPNCYTLSDMSCPIQLNEERKFTGTVKLLEYFDSSNVDIHILFEGINEKLKLNIDLLKKCECENTPNSTECRSAGTLRCGICECNPNIYGDECQCDMKFKSTKPNDNSTCISPASNNTLCNNHGSCSCGQCDCESGYLGKFCECSNLNCDQHDGMKCAGHGDCICSTCYCHAGFTGKACECPTTVDSCKDGDTVCNNRGICTCGKCQCRAPKPSDWDVRQEVDLCKLHCPVEKSCHSRQCQLLEPIVLCYLKEKDCQYDSVNIRVGEIENSDLVANHSFNGWNQCPNVRTEVGCYTTFLYRYIEDSYGIKIKLQLDSNCVESYYLFGGTCLAVLVCIGVITLIAWKCITVKRDRREYERFAKEAGLMDSPCDNPIYAPATSTFYNPGFRKRSDRRK